MDTDSPITPTRPRWYRTVYRLAYRLGLTVWQRSDPPAELVSVVEGTAECPPLPAGRALDLGCGTGTDTVYLARHGWEVTAIDMVPKALAVARRNATAAGVTARFRHGDVTRLDALGVGGGFTLLLDFGCLHTLPDDQRAAYVRAVSSAAAPDATFLLYGFARPPKAAPMHAGLTADEVRHRFGPSGWHLVRDARASAAALGIAVRHADDRFDLWSYQLRRTATGPT